MLQHPCCINPYVQNVIWQFQSNMDRICHHPTNGAIEMYCGGNNNITPRPRNLLNRGNYNVQVNVGYMVNNVLLGSIHEGLWGHDSKYRIVLTRKRIIRYKVIICHKARPISCRGMCKIEARLNHQQQNYSIAKIWVMSSWTICEIVP